MLGEQQPERFQHVGLIVSNKDAGSSFVRLDHRIAILADLFSNWEDGASPLAP